LPNAAPEAETIPAGSQFDIVAAVTSEENEYWIITAENMGRRPSFESNMTPDGPDTLHSFNTTKPTNRVTSLLPKGYEPVIK
jgi:hypothetical protein